MRAYGSQSFVEKKRGGKVWRWLFFGLLFGFAAGFIAATAAVVRKPVELIISTPPPPETLSGGEDGELWSKSENISVRTPRPDEKVESPLIVEGMERTFEQNVVLRLKDAGGRELVKTFTTGTAPDLGIHGPYRAELTFDRPSTRAGTLEVFQGSPKDGSEIDMVTVPVRFE